MTISNLTQNCLLQKYPPIDIGGDKEVFPSFESVCVLGDRIWWKSKDRVIEGTIVERAKKHKSQSATVYIVIADEQARELVQNIQASIGFYRLPITVLYQSKKSDSVEEKELISAVCMYKARRQDEKKLHKQNVLRNQNECKRKIAIEGFKVGHKVQWIAKGVQECGVILAVRKVKLKVDTGSGIYLIRASACQKI